MSIVTYENVDTPVFEIDFLRYLFTDGTQGFWLPYQPDHLYADVDKTAPAVFGGGIASFDDLSGNAVTGPQSVSTARPIMGRVPRTGRRNLLTWTEDFSNPVWVKDNTSVSLASVVDNVQSWEVSVATSGISRHLRQSLRVENGPYRYIYLTLLQGTTDRLTFGVSSGGFLAGSAEIISGDGSVSGSTLFAVTGLSGNPTVVRLTLSSETPSGILFIYPYATSGQTAGDSVIIAKPIAAREETPYQRVTTDYDVTEAGVPSVYYARYDSADDVLPRDATLPAITDGTVVLIGQQGIWIDEGYSFAGGNWSLGPTTYPNGPEGIIGVVGDMLDLVVLDRPLTPQERSKVVAYGIERGSAGLLELTP